MGQTKAAPRITTMRRVRTSGKWITVEVTSTDPDYPAYELDVTAAQYVRIGLELDHRGSAAIPTGENA